jgi:nicotinate-nucleotide pyrophosphorylase (carboxylating)
MPLLLSSSQQVRQSEIAHEESVLLIQVISVGISARLTAGDPLFPLALMNDNSELLIECALSEDIGSGDVTSLHFVAADGNARAFMTVRREGVVSGVEMAARVFSRVDPGLEVEVLIPDGSRVNAGALLMRIEGRARSILTAERTALNFIQKLSGVATLTAEYVQAVVGTRARILDTRKTTPAYRMLEKRAVAHGGGTNHRMGLYDRVMLKDNHLVAGGDLAAVQEMIRRVKADMPGIEVEVEADDITQVRDFLSMVGVDHILLDNMSLEELRGAVELRGERVTPMLEASGGVTLDTVYEIARTGVDFISVGAITHSAPALDIALDFTPG